MNVLITYATSEGQTALVADRLARAVRAAGLGAMAVNVDHARANPAGFDAVIVASPIHMGRYDARIVRFAKENAEALNARPSWFVSVCLTEAQPEKHPAVQAIIDKFLAETGWKPRGTASFAGALKYRSYNPLKRLLMRWIVRSTGSTDTSHDYEFTDWGAVDEFGRMVAASLSLAAAM
jgi:menaquinone-dependent protoporphyrinogen oxidase